MNDEIKTKVNQLKLLLTDSIEFAHISRAILNARLDEIIQLDETLKTLDIPDVERYLSHPEYIQARRDDFNLWGDIPAIDWKYLLEAIDKLKELVKQYSAE